jgi:transcriptional regulator with XRE-family HTH domain
MPTESIMTLREWREVRRLTQRALEKLSKVDESTISNIERRRYPMSEEQRRRLSRGLGIRPYQLLKEELSYPIIAQEQPAPQGEPPNAKKTLRQIRLEGHYRDIEELAKGLRHFADHWEKIEAAEQLARLSNELATQLKGTP